MTLDKMSFYTSLFYREQIIRGAVFGIFALISFYGSSLLSIVNFCIAVFFGCGWLSLLYLQKLHIQSAANNKARFVLPIRVIDLTLLISAWLLGILVCIERIAIA